MTKDKSQEEYLRALASQDEAALKWLLEQCEKSAKWCSGKLSKLDWQDVVQSSLLKAKDAIDGGRFDGKCEIRTWLSVIVNHEYFQVLRQEKRRPAPLPSDLASGPAPDQVVIDAETYSLLQEGLEQLDIVTRLIIENRILHGWKLKQCCTSFDLSISAVLDKYHQGLRFLRLYLTTRSVGTSATRRRAALEEQIECLSLAIDKMLALAPPLGNLNKLAKAVVVLRSLWRRYFHSSLRSRRGSPLTVKLKQHRNLQLLSQQEPALLLQYFEFLRLELVVCVQHELLRAQMVLTAPIIMIDSIVRAEEIADNVLEATRRLRRLCDNEETFSSIFMAASEDDQVSLCSWLQDEVSNGLTELRLHHLPASCPARLFRALRCLQRTAEALSLTPADVTFPCCREPPPSEYGSYCQSGLHAKQRIEACIEEHCLRFPPPKTTSSRIAMALHLWHVWATIERLNIQLKKLDVWDIVERLEVTIVNATEVLELQHKSSTAPPSDKAAAELHATLVKAHVALSLHRTGSDNQDELAQLASDLRSLGDAFGSAS